MCGYALPCMHAIWSEVTAVCYSYFCYGNRRLIEQSCCLFQQAVHTILSEPWFAISANIDTHWLSRNRNGGDWYNTNFQIADMVRLALNRLILTDSNP